MSMSFEETCLELFGTKNLYEIFNLSPNDAEKLKTAQIKKAYYKCSLKFHPDRAEGGQEFKEIATKKFQYLSKAYLILSDDEKRAVYDETGYIDDESVDNDVDKDWCAYWRLLFKKITVQDIEKFQEKYRHSDEEREDLKRLYTTHKGDMNKIMDSMMCATQDDEQRFSSMLSEMIEAEEVENYVAFSKETKGKKTARKRKATKEAKEAEEELKKLTGKSEMNTAELANIIAQRNCDRERRMNNLLDGLAAKYGDAGKKKNRSVR